MLNKIAHIIFAALILTGTVGMTISKHYCGPLLKSVSISFVSDNCCETPMDCCHNETISIEIVDDFVISPNVFEFQTQEINNSIVSDILLSNLITVPLYSLKSWGKPPPPKIQKVLSSLQSFLL